MKRFLIPLLFAFAGWALCAAIMAIGPKIASMRSTLIVHAIGGPLGFALLAYIYHKKLGRMSPLATSLVFIGFVILVDFFLVAMLILKDFGMFASIMGTWLPFALIFLASYVVGLKVRKAGQKAV
jgi:hypothetical protein